MIDVDGNNVGDSRQTSDAKPKLELVERCWRMRTVADAREVVCGIYQVEYGLEVRAEYRDDLLRSQWARDLDAARRIAERIKRTLIEEYGAGEELPISEARS